ncbi:MAG: MFS transporter [Dermatophilaceae bacterium]
MPIHRDRREPGADGAGAAGPGQARPGRSVMPVLVGGHAVNDLYQGAVSALIPFLVAGRGYSLTAVAGLVLAVSASSSVTQPLFGMLIDRHGRPWMVPAGTLLAAAATGAVGLVDGYAATWAVVAAAGLGIASYHPEAARLARVTAGSSHQQMSWFALGGNLGFAAGPLVATPVLLAGGLPATVWLAAPAAVAAALTWWTLRRAGLTRPAPRPPTRPTSHLIGEGGDDWAAFTRLSVVVIARSVSVIGMSTFLGVLVTAKLDTSIATANTVLAVFFVAGCAGTLLGGRLAQRFGRITALRGAYLAAIPGIAATAWMPGTAPTVAAAAVTGVALYIPFSLHTTLGQDYLPDRVGTASGVTLGLAISTGGLLAPALGTLADRAGVAVAVTVLAATPALALLAAARLYEPTPPGS